MQVVGVIDRVSISQIINSGNIRTSSGNVVRSPQSCLYDSAASDSLAVLQDMRFPVICKSLVACGSPEAHHMALVPTRDLFLSLPSGRWFVQEFIDHEAVLYKVYVMGDLVQVVPVPSLPNHAQWDNTRVTFTDSQSAPSKPLMPATSSESAGASQAAPRSNHSHSDSSVSIQDTSVPYRPSQETMELIARQVGRQSGLGLFGFDLLIQQENRALYIVDINYFPSYKALPNFGAELLRYLQKRNAEYVHMRSVLPKALSLHAEHITIIGYGSLLSERSARRTFPTLSHFRIGRLRGFKRIFNLVSVSLLRFHKVDPSSLELASVAARPLTADETDMLPPMIVSAFEVPRSELPGYFEREDRYSYCDAVFHPVTSTDTDIGSSQSTSGAAAAGCCSSLVNCCGAVRSPSCCSGLLCVEFTDEAYRARCQSNDCYMEKVGQYYSGKLWRDDILPARVYASFVLQSVYDLGPECYDNFLDTSFLADGRTSIRQYLQQPERSDLLPVQLRQPVVSEHDSKCDQSGKNASGDHVSHMPSAAASSSRTKAAPDPNDLLHHSSVVSPTHVQFKHSSGNGPTAGQRAVWP